MTDAPWPYLTMKTASRLLNVRADLLEGLVLRGALRAVKDVGRTGDMRPVWLLNRDDVHALRDTLHQG